MTHYNGTLTPAS